ncbi:MAG TPA: FtsQ-type POTRA domain-containing protein [Verrucomicrobiae bacterium]|jgi:cell division septal protein FtsQ
MWFKREQRNRRLNRGHVLDVRLRSDQVRATRTRLASIALLVVAGTVFGLYLLWRIGEWTMDAFLYENSTFAVQDVQVQTDGIIAPEQLRRWAGVKPGANLIALDLAAVKRNLELVPAIDSVSIERVLPRTLKIEVTERKPIAQVNVPRVNANGQISVSVFQLDANGYVMQPLDPRDSVISPSQITEQLPVITGLNVFQVQPGHPVESPQAQAALKLLAAFAHSPMTGLVNFQRIDVSSPQVVVATTDEGGEITFGLNNLDQQLRRWRKIYDLGQRNNRIIASADFAVANNVPVKWASNTFTQQKNLNSTNVRRKNV